jgi:hypothetical protein
MSLYVLGAGAIAARCDLQSVPANFDAMDTKWASWPSAVHRVTTHAVLDGAVLDVVVQGDQEGVTQTILLSGRRITVTRTTNRDMDRTLEGRIKAGRDGWTNGLMAHGAGERSYRGAERAHALSKDLY